MSTAIAKVDDVQMDLTLSQVGSLFAKSGMFTGIKGEAQALTKILAGRELGFSPFASMSDLHIVQGKMTIGAHLFAARLKEHPRYDFEVEEHTSENCVIDFYEISKRTNQWQLAGKSSFSIADAKKAGLFKSGGGYDKNPRNMLYARAMSNGCKWYAPDLFQASTYVPGEIAEYTAVEPDETDEERQVVDSYLEEPKASCELIEEWHAKINEMFEVYGINWKHAQASLEQTLHVQDIEECQDVVAMQQYYIDKSAKYEGISVQAQIKLMDIARKAGIPESEQTRMIQDVAQVSVMGKVRNKETLRRLKVAFDAYAESNDQAGPDVGDGPEASVLHS